MAKTLESILPETNPLRAVPYWESPDGKNLNAIACLEWLMVYILTMDKELPCPENTDTLWHLGMALKLQNERVIRRKNQGVFTTGEPHIYEELGNLKDGD